MGLEKLYQLLVILYILQEKYTNYFNFKVGKKKSYHRKAFPIVVIQPLLRSVAVEILLEKPQQQGSASHDYYLFHASCTKHLKLVCQRERLDRRKTALVPFTMRPKYERIRRLKSEYSAINDFKRSSIFILKEVLNVGIIYSRKLIWKSQNNNRAIYKVPEFTRH